MLNQNQVDSLKIEWNHIMNKDTFFHVDRHKGYKINMKIKILNFLNIFLATYLNHVYKFNDFLKKLFKVWLLKISKIYI